MGEPVIKSCLAGAWTLAIENETSALIHIKDTSPEKYLHTFRTAGDPAPTPGDVSDALPIRGGSAKLSTTTSVDVYIMAVGKNGAVRIDNS
jgi:hypothetical protein